MSGTHFDRVADLFERCLDLPVDEREAFLASVGDVAVVAEVKELLHHRTPGPLDQAAVGWKVDGSDLTESFPRQFGGYELRSVIGRGAQGTVYEAWQASPARPVALKVLNAAAPFSNAQQRFEDEAAILARLQHPGIAAVYAVGATAEPRGPRRPFIAMELVRGRPLLEQAGALGLRERVGLLEKVCAAVHHAHQKAVIHRDLKPGNILVDESGQPKVLDFGIARLKVDEARNLTLAGQVFGTLAYMSPEQVSGRVADVDTQSDVYALGVIAFEMLTGELPYDLAGRPIAAAAQIISLEPPRRPGELDRALRGDIETILLKALEKERDRRYQSARELGEDLRRFLDYQPINARPTTVFYQLSRLARRHRPAVAVAAMLVLAVLIGLATTLWQSREARKEAAAAAQMNAFMENVLELTTARGAGSTITLQDFLDEVAARAERALAGQPLALAAVSHYLGNGYHKLGRHAEAGPWAARAWSSRCALLGDDHPLSLESANSLVVVRHALGDFAGARSLATATLDHRLRRFGPDDRQTLVTADNMLMLQSKDDAGASVNAAKLALIETRQAELARRSHRALGPFEETTLNIENNRVSTLLALGELERADELLMDLLPRARAHLEPTHELLFNLEYLHVACQAHLGNLSGALSSARQVLEVAGRELGQTHHRTRIVALAAAELTRQSGDPGDALRQAIAFADLLESAPDPSDEERLDTRVLICNCLMDLGLPDLRTGG